MCAAQKTVNRQTGLCSTPAMKPAFASRVAAGGKRPFPRSALAHRRLPGSLASRRPVEDHAARRNKLAENIEIPDVSRQHGGAEKTGLVEDQRVIQEPALMPLPFRQTAQAKQQPGHDSGLTPNARVGTMEAMGGNVLDRLPDRFQHRFRRRVGRVQAAEHMRQFGKANGRMVAEAIGEEIVDRLRRTALQHIEIDAGVEEQCAADRRLVRGPREFGIGSSFQLRRVLLRLEGA